MDQFLKFLGEHWEDILSALVLVISVIVFVAKKKPVKVVDTLKEKVLYLMPSVILEAERKYGSGHGEEKLTFVLDFFKWSFDKDGLELTDTYILFIRNMIEEILSTPQKKGVKF